MWQLKHFSNKCGGYYSKKFGEETLNPQPEVALENIRVKILLLQKSSQLVSKHMAQKNYSMLQEEDSKIRGKT